MSCPKKLEMVALIGVVTLVLCGGCANKTTGPTSSVAAARNSQAPSIVAAPIQTKVTSDGTVGYRSIGTGSTIVMIMGYSSSMDGWPPNFVDALARYHRVITLDNSGIGKTSLPPGPLTIGTMADQTHAFIVALGLRRPTVLGWSMGGMIAQSLAAKYPKDLSKLILCATLPGNAKATPPSAAATAALGNPSQANAGALLGLLFPPDQQAKEVPAFTSQISKYPNFYLASGSIDGQQLSALAKWFAGGDPSGHEISHIKVPTLIGDGSDDVLIPPQNDYEMHTEIPGSKLIMYPDAGHGFLFQDANSWSKAILKFIAG